MATQNQSSKPTSPKNGMVYCTHCGEEYSATYRRCPFCDEVSRPVSRRVKPAAPVAGAAAGATTAKRAPADGKRRPPSRSSGGAAYARTSRLSQIIFLVVTLSLIISACVVIGKVIGPMLGGTPNGTEATASQSDTTQPNNTQPPASTAAPTSAVIVSGLTLSHSDVTLSAGESFTITPTVLANESDVTVTWSVDKPDIAAVTSDGTVLNINSSGASEIVQVSATAGDITASCIVRCKTSGGSTPTGTTASSGDVTGTGTIYNAGNGLNIRSEPSTSGQIIASLQNGNAVTILEKVDSSWYKISFDGDGGVTQTGYCSSNYVK